MKTYLTKRIGCWSCLAAVLWLLPGAGHVHAQMIDLNGNGTSDIWELAFGAGGLDPNVDTDGDGVTNRLESFAGTNPFDSNSLPQIAFIGYSSTNVVVSVSSALGKQYQLQSVETLGNGSGSNWTTEASVITGTDTVATLSAPANLTTKFFRVVISDVDSDGDGVNDWEELQLGLNPYKTDSLGDGLNDRDRVTAALQATNAVSIQATVPAASQDGLVPGAFTVSRTGNVNPITVYYAVGGIAGNGIDFQTLAGSVALPLGYGNSATINVIPLASGLLNPRSVTLTLTPDRGYTVGSPASATVIVYNSTVPTGTGLTAQYFDNASPTYSNLTNFTGLRITRVDTNIDFWLGTNGWPDPTVQPTTFSVRWTGQVQPEFSEPYTFVARTDDGAKLWVNGQAIIDNWRDQSVTDTNSTTISLQAGVRYDLKMEYYQDISGAEAHLAWYSPSQVRQIIPQSRLYPASVPQAATAVTSPTSAIALLGAAFNYTNAACNGPTGYAVSALPPGLGYNPTTGVISGTPTQAGHYQITITATNAAGTGAAAVDLQVIDTGRALTREVWIGVAGTNVADIPVTTPSASTNAQSTLEGVTDFGDNYGERMRGYLTAPLTGNYCFWIAASDSAELWISNDSEPVNKVKRAFVLSSPYSAPPPVNGTPPRQWTIQANQKSPWLALVAGQRYYLEVLHKAGVGTNDNVAVGWLRPDQAGTGPTEVVPGYALSPYAAPVAGSIPGTLYAATLLAGANVQSEGVGTATLRLSPDETQATVVFSTTHLTSGVTARHIHAEPYLSHPATLVFDIDTATPQADGSYVWTIGPVGTLSASDIIEVIKEGKSYIDTHTVLYPNEPGEIHGNFTLANGTQTFTPPPAPPAWVDDHASSNAAARFLIQATFGPSQADIARVQSLGYEAWINDQFSQAVSHHLPYVLANLSWDPTIPYPSTLTFNSWWQQSVTAPDQLRQRVALALSEILVVSDVGPLNNNGRVLSDYYDTLLDDAFGNFRDILKQVTLTPAMGLYLDMRQNDKGDLPSGRHPNENYAREVMQLFSIGLYRMWPDGTLVLNSQGNLVPTYDQNVIMGYARVLTGWNYHQTNQANGRLPTNWSPPANYIDPMTLVPTHHEPGAKRILDNIVLPAASGNQADPTKPEFDAYGLQDLEAGLDAIFNNQNVGPFICRQLIQRLVTSNPSRDYLYRVVQKFNDNGMGIRGDLQAVIKAILLDYEARSSSVAVQSTSGKQREPLLRVAASARAFLAPPSMDGTYSQSGGRQITVTSPNPHRLATGNTVFLRFTSGTPPPTTGSYGVTVTGVNTFTVNATGLVPGTYNQSNNIITITSSSHGLVAGNRAFLAFTTGGASNSLYQVSTVPDSSHLTVTTPDPATFSGNCLLAYYKGGYTQARTNITVGTTGNHGLSAGDNVYIDFMSGTAADGLYQVVSVVDEDHFTVTTTITASQSQNSLVVAPVAAPPLVRSGGVTLLWSTWNMDASDSDLTQTPLRSPTVFNFFFPDYKFPGLLASAGLTTPEFQLTSDTSVARQHNFLAGGILNPGSNTNGLSGFKGGAGAIVLDFGPWMTTNYTSSAGVPGLVDALNTLLLGGQLSASAGTTIVGYVTNTTNFPYTTPTPSYSQMRDRVRAVVHLIVTSPDFTIQK